MPNRQNPYHPPTNSESLPTKTSLDWKPFVWLNIANAVALAVVVLISFLWAKYEQAQLAQKLGRRYASYDHEYQIYPINGLILLALIFTIPNVVLFIVQFIRRVNARQ